MPIRDRITWGDKNPLSDPRYTDLDKLVDGIRGGRLPKNVSGGSVFENRDNDLSQKPKGYYREYDVQASVAGVDRGAYRIVLGGGGEVFVTGNHYRDFRQIINMPTTVQPDPAAARIEKERNEVLDKLGKALQKLRSQAERVKGEHKAERELLTDVGSLSKAAVGFAGFVTNKLFNSDVPEILIWNNTFLRLEAAEQAVKGRNVKRAMKEYLFAHTHFLAAQQKYEKWKNGIEAAAVKMQLAIGATALLLIGAAVGAFAATVLTAAGETASAVAAEQTIVRVATAVQRADAVIRIAEATSLAEEEAAEREMEIAIREFLELKSF